jgi:rRNA maturation RNase YbeY
VNLDVSITAETGRAHVPFLREHVAAAHATLQSTVRRGRRLALREMSLALVGDRRMSQLHRQFMGIDGPTDVLTFPIDEDARGRVTSGEVIVCVPQAIRESKPRRIPVRVELLLYAVHGMLHLLGYDDRTARDFHIMHRTEDDILTRLGFGPVFSNAENAAPRRTRTAPRRPSAGSLRPAGGPRASRGRRR